MADEDGGDDSRGIRQESGRDGVARLLDADGPEVDRKDVEGRVGRPRIVLTR